MQLRCLLLLFSFSRTDIQRNDDSKVDTNRSVLVMHESRVLQGLSVGSADRDRNCHFPVEIQRS